jgi:hypothetical protein
MMKNGCLKLLILLKAKVNIKKNRKKNHYQIINKQVKGKQGFRNQKDQTEEVGVYLITMISMKKMKMNWEISEKVHLIWLLR